MDLLILALKSLVVILAFIVFCVGVFVSCMSRSDLKAIGGMILTSCVAIGGGWLGFHFLNRIFA